MQETIAVGTTEAEYVASTRCCTESGVPTLTAPVAIMEDYKEAIKLANNKHVSRRRTRHSDAKYYIIRDTIEQGKVRAIYVVDTCITCRYYDQTP